MGLCATIGGAISDKYGRKTSITENGFQIHRFLTPIVRKFSNPSYRSFDYIIYSLFCYTTNRQYFSVYSNMDLHYVNKYYKEGFIILKTIQLYEKILESYQISGDDVL